MTKLEIMLLWMASGWLPALMWLRAGGRKNITMLAETPVSRALWEALLSGLLGLLEAAVVIADLWVNRRGIRPAKRRRE